ncbi:MAG: DUF3820 family protein [Planctomycetota bacterium]
MNPRPADQRLDPDTLVAMARYRMPYGKHKGTYLSELPEAYLVWFKQQGWPPGRLGRMMASVYEVKCNGLEDILRRVRQIEGG